MVAGLQAHAFDILSMGISVRQLCNVEIEAFYKLDVKTVALLTDKLLLSPPPPRGQSC